MSLFLVSFIHGIISPKGNSFWITQVDAVSPKPIIAVGGLWHRTLHAFVDDAYIPDEHKALVTVVRNAYEAVKKVVEQLNKVGSGDGEGNRI